MARTVIDTTMIEKINQLYKEYGTYAAVSRELGIAASTVKKYVSAGYQEVDESTIKRFDPTSMPEFTSEGFAGVKNFGDLCVLTEREVEEIEELWNELSL